MERRLPIYLVVDCSESMAGPAIEAVSQGINDMVHELRCNPMALETASISIITFSYDARVELPLTDLVSLELPYLKIRCGTAMGAAVRLLGDCLKRDLKKTTANTKGDYKPFVFLLSDGQPTDDFDSAAAQFRQEHSRDLALFYAIACGDDADAATLRKATDVVLQLTDMRRDTIQKFFFWLSASVQSASMSIGVTGEGVPLTLPAFPKDAMETAPPHGRPSDGRPRQVFLRGLCSMTFRPYLMRFVRDLYQPVYMAAASHPLDETTEFGQGVLPLIDSDSLAGCPPCPYCDNPTAMVCSCGAIVCSEGQGTVPTACPECKQVGIMAPDGSSFQIRQSLG